MSLATAQQAGLSLRTRSWRPGGLRGCGCGPAPCPSWESRSVPRLASGVFGRSTELSISGPEHLEPWSYSSLTQLLQADTVPHSTPEQGLWGGPP